MAVHPQVQALLDQMAALNVPPFSSLTPEAARAQILARRLDIPAEDVERTEDRSIPGPGGEIPIRIYRPSGGGSGGALAYYHGGGWVIGNIESHDRTARALANRADCVVISVDYRLAPEHKFPAAVDDAYAAAAWTGANARSLGVDPDRIAVGGDSAGGNLAAAVALMARDAGAPRIAFQLLVYPVTNYDFGTVSYEDNAEGYMLTRESMRWFWNHYLADEAHGRDPRASPLAAPHLGGLPRAIVITAEYDALRDEGEAYAVALRDAGVPVQLTRYDGMIHGFFGLDYVLEDGARAVNEAGLALRKALSAVTA